MIGKKSVILTYELNSDPLVISDAFVASRIGPQEKKIKTDSRISEISAHAPAYSARLHRGAKSNDLFLL